LLDGALAAAIFFPFGVGGVLEVYSGRMGEWAPAALFLAAAQAAPLYWRRQRPLIVLAVVGTVVAAILLLGYQTAASVIAVLIAVYSVSVYAPPRPRMMVAGLVAMALVIGVGGGMVSGRRDILPFITPIAALSLAGWVAGDYVRGRRRFVARLEARAKSLAAEVGDARRLAAEEERLRIARELHDVVAHNVSVIAIQAGAARVSGSAGKAAEQTLESIEVAARDTLAELSRLLGVLRKGDDTAARAPQPGVEQVEALLKPARDAGMTVGLRVTGERRPLRPALDVTAYRIVQEAVTNVLKHSAASQLDVVVDYGPGMITLTIGDDGRGSSQEAMATSTGHGLIGMRERAELMGGDFVIQSAPRKGTELAVSFPVVISSDDSLVPPASK